MRVFNFAAGPATLPLEVLEQVRGELTDWQGSGMSVLTEANPAGLTNLAGHRSVGGMRASIYNAMPVAGVDALIAFMQAFQRRNG